MKFFSCSNLLVSTLCCAQLFSTDLQAVEFEVTSMLGYNFSPELNNSSRNDSLSTTDEPDFSFGFAWQDSPKGQGQILINYISRDFIDEGNQLEHSFDTIYAHFSGISLIKERDYITTVAVGIGAAYFDSAYDSVIYPSLTAAIGTRYEFSDNLAFITEVRAYATLTDEDDSIFCQGDICSAHFDGAVWFDTQVSLGLAYRF